eukprot:scaffold128_cov118-Isochrysis_galbana.AAC.3
MGQASGAVGGVGGPAVRRMDVHMNKCRAAACSTARDRPDRPACQRLQRKEPQAHDEPATCPHRPFVLPLAPQCA